MEQGDVLNSGNLGVDCRRFAGQETNLCWQEVGRALEEWEESLGLASRVETRHLEGC